MELGKNPANHPYPPPPQQGGGNLFLITLSPRGRGLACGLRFKSLQGKSEGGVSQIFHSIPFRRKPRGDLYDLGNARILHEKSSFLQFFPPGVLEFFTADLKLFVGGLCEEFFPQGHSGLLTRQLLFLVFP